MSFINKKIIILFFSCLFHISNQIEETSKDLSLLFNKDPIKQTNDNIEKMSNLLYNKIYINTKIATPNQSIKFYLTFNEYITYITQNYYKKSDSNSYEFTRSKKDSDDFEPKEFKTDNLKTGYESKDILNLNEENIIKDFNFILVDKLNIKEEFYQPVMGLSIPGGNPRPVLLGTNILEQLKNNNIIDKRLFSVFYFNKIGKEKSENKNIDGQIIFGKLPHELKDEKKYEQIKKYNFYENELEWTNAEVEEYHMKWKIKFDSIIFANEQTTDFIGELVIEHNPFVGTAEFKKIINKYFFDEFISKNICKEEQFLNSRENLGYKFYSCDTSVELYFNKYQDNILQFKSKDLNEIFSFKLEELFLQYNNRFFFGVIFDEYQMHGWKLGRLFFEKYPLVFSVDNKAIGYYKHNPNNITNKKGSKAILVFLVLLVIVLLFILFIGIRKYNVLKGLLPRRLKANELNDQYTYKSVEETKREITTEMVSKVGDNSVSSLGF